MSTHRIYRTVPKTPQFIVWGELNLNPKMPVYCSGWTEFKFKMPVYCSGWTEFKFKMPVYCSGWTEFKFKNASLLFGVD